MMSLTDHQDRDHREGRAPTHRLSRRAAGVGLLTVGLVAIAPALAPPASAGTADMQQAEAIAKPSVVFIETTWTGWLTRGTYRGVDIAAALEDSNGKVPPLTVRTSCSGFVAGDQGYVVTAGHCVDDQSVRDGGKGVIIDAAIEKFAQLEAAQGTRLNPGLLDDMRQSAYDSWTVEGQDSGSPPERVVGVYPTKAAFGTVASAPLTGNVVAVRPFSKGDVALLKVPTETPWPALEVAPADSTPDGAPVVAAGYPGEVTSTVDAGATPSMKDGTISGQQTVKGAPFTEISAPVGRGMSGGPVLDPQGRVLGTVSWSPTGDSPGFNFMTATGTVRDILAANGVNVALSATDRAYRTGLTDYFAGKYREAAKDFEQVLKLEPNHVQAQNYHRLAVTKSPSEPLPAQPAPKASGPSALVLVLVTVGILAAIAAVAALLLVRRRRNGQPPAASPLGQGPLLPQGATLAAAPDALPVLGSQAEEGPASPDGAVEPAPVPLAPIPTDESPTEAAGADPGSGTVPEPRSTAEGASLNLPIERGPESLNLFVTYAREDRALVDRLRSGLQRLRHEVWIDDRLVVGDAWWDVILRQIRRSDAVLVAVSPALLQSQASAREQEYARRLGKVILPVSVRPVRPELMPPDLASLQMVDYSDPDVGAAFELADALAHLPPSPALPDPLPEPPPVPLSYFSDLTARVRAHALTLDEQLALVARLRSALSKPSERTPALELLLTLQSREDLYIGPAREIEAILAGERHALGEGQPAETRPDAS